MEAVRPRFTLGRQSSLAPQSIDARGDVSNLSLPEKLDAITHLLFLANKGDVEGIKALYEEGIDLNFADFDDRTALHVAACQGHPKVVKFLLEKGANVNARDRWGSTPLADARHYDNKEVCRILETYGAKLPDISDKVPMRVANLTDVPEYEINPAELSAKRVLGSSKYAMARWHGTSVAVKILPNDLSTIPQSVKAFRNELALLQKLRHPNIVQFLGAVTQNTPMCIVEEYCRGGDLHTHLQQQGRLETEKAVRYALDIARGLNYLHSWKPEPVIHRDLQPSNLSGTFCGMGEGM
eukprot:c16351_g1_i3 orf=980-1867(-)